MQLFAEMLLVLFGQVFGSIVCDADEIGDGLIQTRRLGRLDGAGGHPLQRLPDNFGFRAAAAAGQASQ